jgi:hypothetical protein
MKTLKKLHSNLSFDVNWLGFIKDGLRPIIKILVKNKVEFNSFTNLLREIYVEEAEKHINKTSNDSRGKISSIAFQTGMDRREVSRILKNQNSEAIEDNRSREGSILEHWYNAKPFCEEPGKPLLLKRSGGGLSFESLVQRFGKNISHGAILETLINSNCVVEIDNKLKLIKKRYIPIEGVNPEKIQIASNTLKRLGTTIENNFSTDKKSIFQRNLYSVTIPSQSLEPFKEEITCMITDFYLKLLIPKFDEIEDKYKKLPAQKNNKSVGLSIFYFED